MHYTNEWCCRHHAQHNQGREIHHHGEGCCARGSMPTYFFTREEAITQLQEYLQQLQAEVKGVEERISQLKKAGSES